MEATFEAGYLGPDNPAFTGRGGRTTFQWLEGRFFLTQRFINEHPAAPSGIAIIGAGAEPETLTQHYYDSRGVARIYQMTLDGGIWKLWREAPGFWQRYTGLISGDGNMITGAWGRLSGRADVETRLRPDLCQNGQVVNAALARWPAPPSPRHGPDAYAVIHNRAYSARIGPQPGRGTRR